MSQFRRSFPSRTYTLHSLKTAGGSPNWPLQMEPSLPFWGIHGLVWLPTLTGAGPVQRHTAVQEAAKHRAEPPHLGGAVFPAIFLRRK